MDDHEYDLKISPMVDEILGVQLQFVSPAVRSPGVPILFSMNLDPPIKACASIARKMLPADAEGGVESLPTVSVFKGAVTLEETLFKDFLGLAESFSSSVTSTVQVSEDTLPQVYHFTEGTSPCFVLHRIPFENPMDILEILMVRNLLTLFLFVFF